MIQLVSNAYVYVEKAWNEAGRPAWSVDERDAIGAAIEVATAEERKRCAAIVQGGIRLIESYRQDTPPLNYITPEDFATDLAKDFLEAIERGVNHK